MSELKIKTLCNTTRLKQIKCLGQANKTVSELVNVCGLSQSAVSQHLVKLRKAGFVKANKQGREVIYSVTDTKLSEVSDIIIKLIG